MPNEQNQELRQRGLQKITVKTLIRIQSNTKPRQSLF